jgi:hypothetical protein
MVFVVVVDEWTIHDFYASVHDLPQFMTQSLCLSARGYDDELGSRMALNKVLGRGFASKA